MKAINSFFKNFSKKELDRIIKNVISQISLNSSLFLLQIIFPPLMIFIYGLNSFGIWIFLTAVPSTLSILNFNINSAAKTEMSILFNQNKERKVNEVFNNSLILTIFFIIFLLFSSILVLYFYNLNIEILKSLSLLELKIILSCIFFSFFLKIFNSIFVSSIIYKGELNIETYLDIFFNFFSKILILIFGLFEPNLLFAAYALIIASIIKAISYIYIFLKYNNKKLSLSFALVSRGKIMNLFKLSLPYYFESLSDLLKHSLQILLIGVFFNAPIVGMVSTAKTLFYFMPLRVWGIVSKVLFYEFTKLYSRKDFLLLKSFYKKFIKLALFYIIIFLIASLSIGQIIYEYWLKDAYDLNYVLLSLICLSVSFDIISGSTSFINKSINKYLSFTIFNITINLSIIITAFYVFSDLPNLNFLFTLNLFGSILILIYNIFVSNKLISKLK